jgi:membrane protease YdiL (CAAX protease family)
LGVVHEHGPVTPERDAIPLFPAFVTWFAAWLGGALVVIAAVYPLAGVESGVDLTVPQLAWGAIVSWAAFLIGLWWVSRRNGGGDLSGFRAHYAVDYRPVDLLGIPAGVLTQLALVPIVYYPLRQIWPSTFSQAKLEERAQDLADQAGGWKTVLLVAVVVVGAPIVEELVYRGMLQHSLSRVLGGVAGLLVAAAWFALIHLTPVEYPGLFVAGLVFGGCFLVTGRIGPAIAAHLAFNATGVLMALR